MISPALLAASPTSAGSNATPLYPNVVEKVPDHLAIQNDHQRE